MSDRQRNLLTFGASVLGLSLFAFSAYLSALTYVHDRHHNDFTYYYSAARIGLHHGWNRIFDLGYQNTEFGLVAPGLGVAFQSRYLNPPPLAWLAAPFTALPFEPAYWLWVGLSLGALLVAWALTTAGTTRLRVALLCLGLGLLPVGFAIQLGQPSLLVAALVAASAWLLRRDRQTAAGLVLSLAVVKPQLVWLVPLCLLLAGYARAFVAWAAASTAFAVAIALSLGSAGLSQYLDLIRYAEALPVNHHLVVSDVFGVGPQARVIQLGLAGACLAAARLRRGQGSDTVIAIGLLGSAAAAPYLHLADMVLLVLAGWLYLRRPRPAAAWMLLALSLVAMEFAYSITPVPFFLAEVVCLLALLFRRPAQRPVPLAAEAAQA